MHLYDPNGELRARRQQRERAELVRACVFGAGMAAALIALMAAATLR